MRKPRQITGATACGREGVTLVEVLMSLMIMSIGVALVASLFPVAALRSAQATKLTHGAILKYNVEAIVNTSPELIFDPDGDYNPAGTVAAKRVALGEHFRSAANRNYIVDPNGYLAHAEAGATTDGPGVANPTGFCSWFGNNGNTAPYTGSGAGRGLRRYDGGLQAAYTLINGATAEEVRALRLIAAQTTGLGDGWDTVVDEAISTADLVLTGGGGTAEGVTFPASLDMSAVVSSANMVPRNGATILIPDPELYRITIFSLTEKMSQSFPLTRISGQTCYWTENAAGSLAADDLNQDGLLNGTRPLPAEFGGAVARAMIQVKRTNDFNWMLTVRRGGDGRAYGVDVVVTFNNGVEPEDERVYPVVTDIDDTGPVEGGFVAGQFLVEATYASAGPKPSLRRGGFVLDLHNARWYRIQDYTELSDVDTSGGAAPGTTTIQLRVESAVVESSPAGSALMLLPTVIEVYPMGGRSLPEALNEVTFR